jgi:hypothetical protein
LQADLLCEDLNDCAVYAGLAAIFARRELGGSVAIGFRHGGGAGTSRSLERASQAERHPLLCVVDSDRDRANGGAGATARACLAASIDDWRISLYVLEARELENLLATSVVALALPTHAGALQEFKRLPQDIADFVCLKSGEPFCRFREVGPADVGHLRTRAALVELALQLDRFRTCRQACDKNVCASAPRLGEGALRAIGDWLSSIGNQRIVPAIAAWHSELQFIAKRVAVWGFAFPRML